MGSVGDKGKAMDGIAQTIWQAPNKKKAVSTTRRIINLFNLGRLIT